jgi:hypothetical protein
VLRALWCRGVFDVEVLRSEFDAHGYDLVMARGRIVRHIQLKGNWRITFTLDNGEICNLNLEDYH